MAACARPASADPWSDFLGAMNGFLILDNQDFKSVQCTVEVASLQQMLRDLKSLDQFIAVTGDPRGFKMIVDKGAAPRYEVPKVDLALKPGVRPEKRAQLEASGQELATALDQTLAGAEGVLNGVMEQYSLPKKARLERFSFKRTGERMRASYVQEGTAYSLSCSEHLCEGREDAPTSSFTSRVTMVSIHEKLAPGSSEFSAVRPGNARRKGTLRISYQDLGGLDFPARIQQTATQEAYGSALRTDWDISLKDCLVTRARRQ